MIKKIRSHPKETQLPAGKAGNRATLPVVMPGTSTIGSLYRKAPFETNPTVVREGMERLSCPALLAGHEKPGTY